MLAFDRIKIIIFIVFTKNIYVTCKNLEFLRKNIINLRNFTQFDETAGKIVVLPLVINAYKTHCFSNGI